MSDQEMRLTREEEAELRDRLTREAMDEARRGLFIDDEEVKAWARSLSTPNPLPLPKPRSSP
jgi:predicted transcriptional regulator